MKFIEILLSNSTVKESKLYNAAKKANINPESGITILNKSAFHVIKDCASLAVRYLPHYIFGQYDDPFRALKSKFTRNDIVEFVESTNSDFSNRQLLILILNKVDKTEKDDNLHVKSSISYDTMTNDPYGEYGIDNDTTKYVNQYTNSSNDFVDILCEAFGVNS